MSGLDPDDPYIASLLEAIADGATIDWEDAAAHGVTSDMIDELQALLALGRSADGDPGAGRSEQVRWGPLTLRELIGAGTFGTVYRAWDPTLQRYVAVKLWNPERIDGAERLLSEARALAQVTHQHVVTIFGADVHDDRPGLWMEFVEGRTLQDHVQTNGPLSAQEALVYGREVCAALAAVHRAGLVHGDIKAHNVMRARGGRIVLMDFGAARFRTPGRYRAGLSGSPLYLAPEVLLGSTPTASSDLYGLGVLLYYLVSGEFPVVAESLEGLRNAHSRRERRRLRDARPDLPPAFVLAVDAATAPLPDARPGSAGALEDLLETALGRTSPPVRTRPDGRRDASVAILPFSDLTPERHLAYFCDGLAEEIFEVLTRTPGLRAVAAWSTAAPSRLAGDTPVDVGTILEGSVRAVGSRLRVNARLLDGRTRARIWSKQFTRDLDDVFGVQDEIAQATALELGGRIAAPGPDDTDPVPQGRDPEAYRLYLKGRHCWNSRTENGLHLSVSCFQEAIARDPAYTEAHAGLAVAFTTLGLYGVVAPHDVMPRAKAAAATALAQSEQVSAAHAAAACIAAVYDWNWQEAARGFHRALESNVPLAHHWYAINYLVPLRRFDEAAAALRRAADADPFSAPVRASLGLRSYFAHEFAEAERALRETLEVEPGAASARLFLGLTLVEQGDCDGAARELETAVHLAGSPEMEAALGYALARGGHADAAREILSRLISTSGSRYVSPSLIAQVHLGLGEPPQALDWLERALAVRASDLAWLNVRPLFNPLRADARFHALVTRIHNSYG